MKAFFSLVFLILLYSCSVSEGTASNPTYPTKKAHELDTTAIIKPQTLNGKVITPSQNNSTISPKKEKK